MLPASVAVDIKFNKSNNLYGLS